MWAWEEAECGFAEVCKGDETDARVGKEGYEKRESGRRRGSTCILSWVVEKIVAARA